MSKNNNHNKTLYACYIGYITQAVINNFAPLLFLTLHAVYKIPSDKITLLVTVNFGVQLFVDLAAVKYADKIGYRPLAVFAHIFAAFGLAGFGILPEIFPTPYSGLLTAVILYAIGGGLIEVLISPIAEACPTEKKSSTMSLLHSFYCWGHVLVIICSTLFFAVFGIDRWKILSVAWAVIPLANAFFFSRVPIYKLTEKNEISSAGKLLSLKLFWVFVLLMVCSGASEQAMSQWASAFAESGLRISKTVGDLAGPGMFAVLMGISRVLYSVSGTKIKLQTFMICSGFLSVAGYLLASLSPHPVLSLVGCGLCGVAAGILWPGTFSLASAKYPGGGTAMFAFMALAGDLGCSFGPTVVGIISNTAGGGLKTAMLAAVVFPVMLILGLFLLKRTSDI